MLLTCSACRRELPEDDFSPDKRSPTGHLTQCKRCRHATIYKHQYPTPCSHCGYHRRLNSNQVCAKCNHSQGLRECWKCHAILPIFISFYSSTTMCKQCVNKVIHPRPCVICKLSFTPKNSAKACSPKCRMRFRKRQQAAYEKLHKHDRNIVISRRDSRLRLKYRLTPAQFDSMLIAQDGRCGICNEPLSDKLHIDHDHRTKQLRGILCRHCNIGLGHFFDDPSRLEGAAKYVRDCWDLE